MDKTIVERMNECLAHRGPDDSGLYTEPSLVLGHRRLSIIDLSAAGRQPMSNGKCLEQRRTNSPLCFVFNGEIYNFSELRDGLARRGHVFQSQTDSEVILHLYEEEGEGCVEPLRGMFAFALWDALARQLVLGRDRSGEKPLLYAVHENVFYFASEIQALLSIPGFPRNIDPTALRQYFNFLHVPQPDCMLRAIQKLPPATTLTVTNGQLRERQYWKPSYRVKWQKSENELVEELRIRLDDVVKTRLVSDVPLGSMLSGGIDSTAVTALAQRHVGGRLKTFSAFFADEEGRDSDWRFAQLAADRLGVEHSNVFYNADDLLNLLPLALKHYGEPHAIITTLVSLFLSRHIKKHVKVVLSGNGGDEVFGGYLTYKKVLRLNSRFVQRGLDFVPHSPFRWLRQRLAGSHRAVSGEMGMMLYALSLSNEMRRSYNIATSDIWLKSQLFSDGVLDSSQDPCAHFRSVFSDADADRYFDAWLHTDLMSRMQEYTVVQPDISGMTYGLEIRAPFLDHELIQFAAGLTPDMKIRRGRITKYLLRRAVEGLIPDEIVNRQDKTGFSGVTYAHLISLAQGRWKPYFEDSLFAGSLQKCGYFQPKFIENTWRTLLESQPRSADATLLFQTIWSLLVFEHWWRAVMTR